MKQQTRTPIRTTDPNGRKIVLVPLAKGLGDAVLDEDDFDRLLELGLSSSWYLNGNVGGLYVRAGLDTRGNGVGIARVIVGARGGQVVKYRDGDTTNLRRSNLWVTRGASKRADAQVVQLCLAA